MFNTYLPANYQNIDDIDDLEVDNSYEHLEGKECPECHTKDCLYEKTVANGYDDSDTIRVCENCNYVWE
jgi:DNA-directed RNA polymerase subunit M/transcription elongation factor TFIIS